MKFRRLSEETVFQHVMHFKAKLLYGKASSVVLKQGWHIEIK